VRIGTHALVLLVSEDHPFAERNSVSLKDLDGMNFTTYDSDSQLGGQIKALFQSRDIHPNIVMEARQDLVIYGLVSSGHSVAITPLPLAGEPYNVKPIPISDDIPQRDLYLIWNKERYMPPAAGYFRDFLAGEQDLFNAYLKRCPGSHV
jgi:DNA-binding transcriptional LysR family regulator